MRRMTTMATILALSLLAALPATAADDGLDCITINIGHKNGQTFITSREGPTDDTGMRATIVGHFVWFQWLDVGKYDSHGDRDTLSFDVSDPTIIQATGCSDGSVEIVHAEPAEVQPTPDTTEAPEETPPHDQERERHAEPLTPVCEVHADVLARYCELPNRVLVIS